MGTVQVAGIMIEKGICVKGRSMMFDDSQWIEVVVNARQNAREKYEAFRGNLPTAFSTTFCETHLTVERGCFLEQPLCDSVSD
jgi:hypothetical protein